MRLHRSGIKPDWEIIKPARHNFWQRLATSSWGVFTLSNAITLAGLIFVLWGALLILQKNYPWALAAIFAGRLADIFDGMVAELTKTKGPLGESFDAIADKLALLLVLPTLAVNHIVPMAVIVVMLLYGIVNATFGILSKTKNIAVHPTAEGKLATAAGWLGIGTFLLGHSLASFVLRPWHGLALFTAWGLLVVFVVLAYRSSWQYGQLIFNSKKLAVGSLTEYRHVILVINPQSTNIHRIKKRSQELDRLFPGQTITTIETTPRRAQLNTRLKKMLVGQEGTTLLCIGGGDGTLNSVLNCLMGMAEQIDLTTVLLLPLWGGNANDFAYMVNGVAPRTTLQWILARGQPVAIHPFEITTTGHSRNRTVVYAACYASFGASAYAAEQLTNPRKDSHLLVKSTAGKLLAEAMYVIKALLDAPVFTAEQDGHRMQIFEHVFVNGSRMAKLDRLPVKLNEKAFYKAVESEKHPLALVLQFLRGKKIGRVTNKPVKFTTKERAWAQFDGEAVVLPKNTTVTVGHAKTPFYALSTKLDPDN